MRFKQIMKLPPDMCPTGNLNNLAILVKSIEACIPIGLQCSSIVAQVLERMLRLAIRRIGKPNGGRVRTSCRSVISNVGPQSPRLGLAVSRGQYGDRNIIAV